MAGRSHISPKQRCSSLLEEIVGSGEGNICSRVALKEIKWGVKNRLSASMCMAFVCTPEEEVRRESKRCVVSVCLLFYDVFFKMSFFLFVRVCIARFQSRMSYIYRLFYLYLRFLFRFYTVFCTILICYI